MKVLVACEFSGIVRDAFLRRGHDAISCDLLPTESPGPHYQGDVFSFDLSGYDLIIAHPPCTHLSVSGARWFKDKQQEQKEAIDFFMYCINLPCDKITVENPVCIMSTIYRKPDQYIQPWQFGHPETKKTGLWLKGLPLLQPSNIVEPKYIIGKDGKKYSPVHYCSQWINKTERWKIRSKTYQGIAAAMAEQWGSLI